MADLRSWLDALITIDWFMRRRVLEHCFRLLVIGTIAHQQRKRWYPTISCWTLLQPLLNLSWKTALARLFWILYQLWIKAPVMDEVLRMSWFASIKTDCSSGAEYIDRNVQMNTTLPSRRKMWHNHHLIILLEIKWIQVTVWPKLTLSV